MGTVHIITDITVTITIDWTPAKAGRGCITMKNIGEIIAELRTEKQMGQKELAVRLNVSVGTISNYEKGVHFPDLESLRKIADIFNVTVDYLLGRTGYRCPPESLKEYITTDYTISEFVNTVISLDTASRNSVTDFANYLKDNHPKESTPPKAD